MKSNRKAKATRKLARRASPTPTLTARVARLEAVVGIEEAPATDREPSSTAREFVYKPAARSGAMPVGRYVNLDARGKQTAGDHVAVYDRLTGLTWSAEPLASGKSMSHADAMKAYATLDLAGHKDWRAPTIQELLSLIDYGRTGPAVDPAHFKGPYGWTWTSTPYAGNPSGAAWDVNLDDGYSYWCSRGDGDRARAVRAGQQFGFTE